MAQRLHCPGCKAVFDVPAELGGTSIRCRDCRAVVRVPKEIPVVTGVDDPPIHRRIQDARRVVPPVTRSNTPARQPAPPRRFSPGAWVIITVVAGLLLLSGIFLILGLVAIFY